MDTIINEHKETIDRHEKNYQRLQGSANWPRKTQGDEINAVQDRVNTLERNVLLNLLKFSSRLVLPQPQ